MTHAHVAYARELREGTASHARAGPDACVLRTITETDCGIAIWQRPVDPVAQDQAAALAASEHLAARLTLASELLARDVVSALAPQCGTPSAIRALLEDIQRLAGHFAAVASILEAPRTVTLRLETLQDDACRRFHVDRVRLRLLCTYLGPGTEWLTDDQVDREALATYRPNEAILRRGEPQRLEPFWVAILKGDLYPGTAGHGQVHRSPPIAASGIRRILFCLDV